MTIKNNQNEQLSSNAPKKKESNFAFIDSQNLNLGTQRMGWKLDWRKFRKMLETDYGVTKAFTFIGYMSGNEQLYEYMHELGYLVVLKPTLDISHSSDKKQDGTQEKEKAQVKGNVDVELVLYALKEMPNYDGAVIVSGDGDFYSLIEFLTGSNKLKKIIAPNWQYSSLLKPYEDNIVRLDKMRRRLEYKKRRPSNG
ncbi:MAG TPA: NYN domain-containing protein [Candidatus Sulfotelmatobacter sp.]|nr:NYN domain-containing protein [Candidatus Sulfotelmatobacter sp.]